MRRGWANIAIAAVLTVTAVAVLMAGRMPRGAEAATTLYVTSSADSGAGTLRAAITSANSDSSVNLIVLKNWLPVTLFTSVEYTGTQALTIQGDQPLVYRTIQGSLTVPGDPNSEPLDCGMFKSTGGADITFSQVTIQNSWCDALNIVPVVGDSEITITFNKVNLRNNFGSGMFLHEIEAAEATVRLNVTSSQVVGNGRCRGSMGCAFGGIELQGLGEGEVVVQLAGTWFNGNGGDGMSIGWDAPEVTTLPSPALDVDISVTASNTTFNDNGGTVTYAAALGEGSRGRASTASHQGGEGLGVFGSGLGTGDVTLALTNVQANRNGGSGIRVFRGSDIDVGDVRFTANTLTASNNGGAGIQLEDEGDGDVIVSLTLVSAWFNQGPGVDERESGEGGVDLEARNSSVGFNHLDGFRLEESGDGDFSARFNGTVVSGNAGDGLDMEEHDSGAASAAVQSSSIFGNGESAIEFEAHDEFGTISIGVSFIVGGVDLDHVNQLF
ncbi:MAG: hypothetical protein U0446_02635 [Dehalococcoidia bacterium]